MRHAPDITKLQSDASQFLGNELAPMAKEENWQGDRPWTDAIHKRFAEIGHSHGYLVFASQNRCPAADGPEWLYDHHWRISGSDSELIRMPLVMEIEWGFGATTLFEEVRKDFLKLVQARADFRVMVFQGNNIASMTDRLVALAECFEGSERGDHWLFAGWGWDTEQMHCRLWNA